MSKSNSKNILMLMTGSIACYKACSVISRLKQKGFNIKVVMSPSSLEFIGKSTIEGLTGTPPITDMYASGHNMDHINLIRWADLILVAPATANYINKIAHGLGDDLLSTLFLAHDFSKPFLIAPAMNTKMYLHPTTQHSIEKLKHMQVEILETASGVLACGEIGSGKLLEPELILDEVESRLTEQTQKNTKFQNIRILITAGGTSEPIDDVRVITNRSSGRTAAAIADSLIKAGINVTYLNSLNAIKPENACETYSFESFTDLQSTLSKLLTTNKFQAVVHAAAVSDYSVVPHPGKINSEKDEVLLTLRKNPKLINEIKKLSPQSQLFAFKLTSNSKEEYILNKITSLFKLANCDFIIQNDWNQIKNKNYLYTFYDRNMKSIKIEGLDTLSSKIFQNLLFADPEKETT